MLLFLSTIVMLILFGGLIVFERKAALREKVALGKLSDVVADLAVTAKTRYQETYGRDPTTEITVYRDRTAAAKK